MQRIVFVVLLSAIACLHALAQDFRPGFILKLNGDSLTGYVKNGSAKGNSQFCYFKTAKSEKAIKYSPTEIRGFGITDDKYFEAKTIPNKGGDPYRYFLEILVKGKMSLYKGPSLFYVEKDSLFLLSREPVSQVEVDGRTYNSTILKYMPVLNYAMLDCNLKADGVGYQEKGLVNLVQQYNRCKGGAVTTYKTKKPWTKFSASIFSGTDQASVKLDEFARYTVSKSVSVPVGIGMEVSAPRLSDKTYFSLELWYDKKFYQGYGEATSGGSTTRSDLLINTAYLKMPLGIRFNLLPDANTPYIRLGFVPYILLNATGTIVNETETGGVVMTDRSAIVIDKKNPNGFWGGVGYSRKIHKMLNSFLEVRFEKNTAFTGPNVSSNSSGTTINFLIGIKF